MTTTQWPIGHVSGKYGAPMGRAAVRSIEVKGQHYGPSRKMHLRKVPLDAGGYDRGGAYWGIGSPLYVAYDDDFRAFFRADDRDDAKAQALTVWPLASFYR